MTTEASALTFDYRMDGPALTGDIGPTTQRCSTRPAPWSVEDQGTSGSVASA